jgi:hypothetical protein
MLRSILVAALAAAAVPALAEEMRLVRPAQPASFATGPVVFSAYYVAMPDESYRVTAIWRDAGDGEAVRVTMHLAEGDAISFTLPGHPDDRFTLSRDQDSVTIRTTPVVRFDDASLRSGPGLRNDQRI